MDSYKNNPIKRPSRSAYDMKRVWVSSKADAFIDGIASLLEIYPDPRQRTIRAFHRCYSLKYQSVNEALLADWAAIAQDMCAAINTHEQNSTEEESLARLKTIHAR